MFARIEGLANNKMGKKKRKNRKEEYDPARTLRFEIFPHELEEQVRALYDQACCGSRAHWEKIHSPEEFKSNKNLRHDFMFSAHKGMREAQDSIIKAIQSDPFPTSHEICLYRGIADAIGWQILGMQLCYARRFFKGYQQPNLRNCNFGSVVEAANNLIKEKPNSIPLICDLTSFIQVGDIIQFDPQTGITICEVKEGDANSRIFDFMHFLMESKCERAFQLFAIREGKESVKQLGRMFRQTARMAHVGEVMSQGTGSDPDTKELVRIPEKFIQIDSWDEELNETIDNSQSKGWAINVIDNCLFVGCYSESPMKQAGHIIFNGWFDSCGGNEQCPRGRMIDSMQIPLALPLFCRSIPPEVMFDLLFGRKQICMAISIEGLLKECGKVGLSVREASNKETSKLEQRGAKPFKHNKHAICISDGGGKEIVLMDGIFLRSMFHGQKPISLIRSILSHTEDT